MFTTIFCAKMCVFYKTIKRLGGLLLFALARFPFSGFPFLFFQSNADGNRACSRRAWVAIAAMAFLFTMWDIILRRVNIGMPRLRVLCASAVDFCSNRDLHITGAIGSAAQWTSDTTTIPQVMAPPTIGASICNTSNASMPRPISGGAGSFPPVPILTDAIAIISIAISIGN